MEKVPDHGHLLKPVDEFGFRLQCQHCNKEFTPLSVMVAERGGDPKFPVCRFNPETTKVRR